MIELMLYYKSLRYLAIIFLSCYFTSLSAQNDNCNKLGVWLWHIETTGFSSHASLADSLLAMGVKRIYVKVSDGSVNTTSWPELIDEDLIQQYKSRGLEVWAWSYNYPGNNFAQAEALRIAAQTGYEGFIVDVEMDFDGQTALLSNLFTAFYNSRTQAITDGIITDSFPIGITTWGNPMDHNFRIDLVDPFVDAYFPQTYVENWGNSFIDNLSFWIEEGNAEYKSLGATKPINHIVSTEKGNLTGQQLNEFIATAGPETSLWRIPGGGTPLSIWNDWAEIDWFGHFCEMVAVNKIDNSYDLTLHPNPASEFIKLKGLLIPDAEYEIYNLEGMKLKSGQFANTIQISDLSSGYYILRISQNDTIFTLPFIKN